MTGAEAGVAVKVCGLCRPGDASAAAAAGASWLGVILSDRGPRALDVATADSVLAARGAAGAVGVVVDETVARMAELVATLALDVVQLHGVEPVDRIEELRARRPVRVWKAVRVREPATALAEIRRYAPHVDGILLDGWSEHGAGGTGTSFDWSSLEGVRRAVPAGVVLVVAGGLSAANVTDAIGALAPDVVDVSSGVEARPREKSHEQVRAFIHAARAAQKGAGR